MLELSLESKTDYKSFLPKGKCSDGDVYHMGERKNLKILVLGWYNRLNIGDERIRYSISKLLNPHPITFHNLWEFPIPFDLFAAQDLIIIGGGGLWVGESAGLISIVEQWHPKIRAHIGVLGVSAETIEPFRTSTEYLLEKANFFEVRDHKSKVILGGSEKIAVYPDLTFHTPFRWDPCTQPNGIALCFAATYLNDSPNANFLRELRKDFNVFGIPFDELDDADYRCFQTIDIPTQSYFDGERLRRAELAVCSRFHGIIFCIQMGVPFIALNSSGKIRNFCEENGLGDFLVPFGCLSEVQEKIVQMRNQRENILDRIEKVREKLVMNSAEHRQHFLSEIDKIIPHAYGMSKKIKMKLFRSFF